MICETSTIKDELESLHDLKVLKTEPHLSDDGTDHHNNDQIPSPTASPRGNVVEPELSIHIAPKSKPKRKRRFHVSTASPETQERLYTNLLLNNIALLNPSDNRLRCDICEYSTLRRYKMAEHMERFHTATMNGEAQLKPYCCETCGIRMSEMGNLKKHMKLHTGHKPYPCLYESCDRRFFGSSERTIHMRRHMGEKPYKCDQCPDAFISKSQMTNHKRNRHSDYRPYNCTECGQSFKLPKTFKNHQLTHTDIRQYHCDICGKSFRQRSAFQVHVNIHTDNRPYKCSICDRGFHSSAARRSHEKLFHKIT